MSSLGIVALSAAIAASASSGVRAEESPPPQPDLKQEIAWARATWPGHLEGVHFHSPLARLLTWAPRRGSIPVFLYTDDIACRAVALGSSQRAENDVGVEASSWILPAQIKGPTRFENGGRVREITYLSVGRQLLREDGTAAADQTIADGRWRPEASQDLGYDPTVYGVLSYADQRVARWDGTPVVLHAYCGGPVDWLACPKGGEHPCERCEEVSVLLSAPESLWGHSRSYGSRTIGCRDTCPIYPQSPDIAGFKN